MSTSFYAKTVLVHPEIRAHEFESADDLMSVTPQVLEPAPGLKTFAGTGTVITEVRGSSNRNYFSLAVRRLGALSSIGGLGIFDSSRATPAQWEFQPDEGAGWWAFTCGYWLEGAALAAAYDALDRLLQWARENERQLTLEEFIGYYMEEPLLETIDRGDRATSPRVSLVDPDNEGAGPAYLFAYLGSVRHLFANAIASGHAVLHVTEFEDSGAAADLPVTPFSEKYDAKYWLNEGDLLCEEAEDEEGKDATRALKEAIKCYTKALEMDPELGEAHYGWGCALRQLAGKQRGKKAKETWGAAIAQFESALAKQSGLTSDLYDVLVWMGQAMEQLALLAAGDERKALWKSAIARYEAALQLPAPEVWPNMEVYEALASCGWAMLELASLSPADEANSLHAAAKVKSEAVIALVPDEPRLLHFKGQVSMNVARSSEGEDKERWLGEAEVKYQGAEKFQRGSASVSYACLCGLRGDAAGALRWLKLAESCGILPSRKDIKAEQDFALIRSDPAFVAWLAA